jgi:hypothetical protein
MDAGLFLLVGFALFLLTVLPSALDQGDRTPI